MPSAPRSHVTSDGLLAPYICFSHSHGSAAEYGDDGYDYRLLACGNIRLVHRVSAPAAMLSRLSPVWSSGPEDVVDTTPTSSSVIHAIF